MIKFSFPRAAWECCQHRAAVLRRDERRRVTPQYPPRSHAERENEKLWHEAKQ
jgi:hypothetical protein